MIECDELIVPPDLWDRAKTDQKARDELKEMFDGMTLYAHALAVAGKKVTAREFCALMGDRLTLTVGFE